MDACPNTVSTAVDSIYREHHSWFRGWILQRLNCHEQAADLAQDTFIRLLQQSRSLDIREPRAYLSTVAKGLIIDRFRRRSLEQAYLESLVNFPEPVTISEETRAEILETLVLIDRLLDDMEERTRQVFLMAQIDGLTYKAISEKLGVSVNTVRKHFTRALIHCMSIFPD